MTAVGAVVQYDFFTRLCFPTSRAAAVYPGMRLPNRWRRGRSWLVLLQTPGFMSRFLAARAGADSSLAAAITVAGSYGFVAALAGIFWSKLTHWAGSSQYTC